MALAKWVLKTKIGLIWGEGINRRGRRRREEEEEEEIKQQSMETTLGYGLYEIMYEFPCLVG